MPFNSRPIDIAGIRFYQFININIGTSCYQLITMNGWPTTEQWKNWEAWWNKNMQKITEQEDEMGIKTPTASWPMQVAHITAMIVQMLYDIHTEAAMNITQLQVESLTNKVKFIKNALYKLAIKPIPNEKSWLSNIWEINAKLQQDKITVWDMQQIIASIIPAKIQEEHILYVSTPAKDLIKFRDHEIAVATASNIDPRTETKDENRPHQDEQEKSQTVHSKTFQKDKKQKKRKIKTTRTPPTLKREKRQKYKLASPEESSEEKSTDDSSEEDTIHNETVMIESSSSESEYSEYEI